VGAGKLGQLLARVLALTGCDLTVAARHEHQRRLLRDAAIETCAPDALDHEGGFDIVVEASGSPDGFATARRSVRPQGTLVLKSTYAGRLELDASSLVVDEITVVGSRCGPFDAALRLLARRDVDPLPLVEARYGLDEADTAFEHARRPGALKVVLDVAEGERGEHDR
jgi:threonine dehydrogenase-like Zn-dependent dehydrogenase